MKYFTLKELTHSSTADAKKIDNTPTEEVKKHLEELCDNLLDPIREAWGSGIKITSGYRGTALNKAVGGSNTSAHHIGYAADMYPSNGNITEFKEFVKTFLKSGKFKFDQYINEYKGNSQWVHVAIKNRGGKQRGQYMIFKNSKYTYIS